MRCLCPVCCVMVAVRCLLVCGVRFAVCCMGHVGGSSLLDVRRLLIVVL